jgi:hypothetical protein
MKKIISALMVSSVALSACQATIPQEALNLSQESLQQRQMQTRRFDTKDESKLLQAASAVVQDLGFTLEESETKLGVIVGSKDRDATEAGQVAGAIMMAVLFGASVPIDAKQKIRASLVTKPVGPNEIQLRVTFQRLVWDTRNNLSKIEGLVDQKIYQEFFDKLSQSVFLTANQI